jgi:hypothetical protein
MGRHTGKSQRDQLKTWLAHLSATCFEIADTKEKRRYWGSLLPRGADKVDGGYTLYAVEINRALAEIFQSGIAFVDWKERQELRGKWPCPLASAPLRSIPEANDRCGAVPPVRQQNDANPGLPPTTSGSGSPTSRP